MADASPVARLGRWVGWAALLAVVVVGVSLALREVFTRRYPGGNDLYPRWAAGCAWLERGQDPYGREATLEIQRGIYGRAAYADEDQAAFAYPIYTVVLTWPLCLADDFATAHAFAMSGLIGAVVLTVAAARGAVGLRLGKWAWGWTVAWIALLYPSVRGVLLGQPAVVVSLLQVSALLALRRERDGLAGAALALSTVKPQMALLFVPWVLVWTAFRGRRRVIVWFAGTLALLTVVPMLWLPAWPLEWLEQLRAYTSYTEVGSATWILTSYLLGTPPQVEWILTGILLAWMGTEAVRHRKVSFEAAIWPASLALVLTHFVSPRTATTHFGSLVVPFFLLVRLWHERSPELAERGVTILMPAVAAAGWILFLATVEGRQESPLNYLPIPIVLLGALIWARRPWRALATKTT